MTWAQRAGEFIANVDQSIPADTPLKVRTQILNHYAWQFHGGTSWGRKAWARAKRQYLEGHGQAKGKGHPKAPVPLFETPPATSPVKWLDNPASGFTTAFLGVVIVGRVFYAEKRARYFCNLSMNCLPHTVNKARNRYDAEQDVEKQVAQWLVDAGLQAVLA